MCLFRGFRQWGHFHLKQGEKRSTISLKEGTVLVGMIRFPSVGCATSRIHKSIHI